MSRGDLVFFGDYKTNVWVTSGLKMHWHMNDWCAGARTQANVLARQIVSLITQYTRMEVVGEGECIQ